VRDASGSIVVSRILRAGETYNAPNRPGLVLSTGNAGALDVRVDGRAAPAIGRPGMVERAIALDPERLSAGTARIDAPPAAARAPGSQG
jgi:cytoskeleton protein RodZ